MIGGKAKQCYHTKSAEVSETLKESKDYEAFVHVFPEEVICGGADWLSEMDRAENTAENPEAEAQSSADEQHPAPTPTKRKEKFGKVNPAARIRLCDDNCKDLLDKNWGERVLGLLRSLINATPLTSLNLDSLMRTLVEVEKCERCEAKVEIGGGCYPTKQCTDQLRFLRNNVAPHFAQMRTLLRQVYTLRAKIQWVTDLERSMAQGNVQQMLDMYDKMGAPGKDKSDAGMDSLTDSDIGNIPEKELESLLQPIINTLNKELDDMPNK